MRRLGTYTYKEAQDQVFNKVSNEVLRQHHPKLGRRSEINFSGNIIEDAVRKMLRERFANGLGKLR